MSIVQPGRRGIRLRERRKGGRVLDQLRDPPITECHVGAFATRYRSRPAGRVDDNSVYGQKALRPSFALDTKRSAVLSDIRHAKRKSFNSSTECRVAQACVEPRAINDVTYPFWMLEEVLIFALLLGSPNTQTSTSIG
jgi:hypothetical protein